MDLNGGKPVLPTSKTRHCPSFPFHEPLKWAQTVDGWGWKWRPLKRWINKSITNESEQYRQQYLINIFERIIKTLCEFFLNWFRRHLASSPPCYRGEQEVQNSGSEKMDLVASEQKILLKESSVYHKTPTLWIKVCGSWVVELVIRHYR